ncbi:MAG TPA: hypothetical protein VG348_15805 [Acidimicrobiia bacterium]|nr:hypothetical protein [Acidimicrobiia bacterium]
MVDDARRGGNTMVRTYLSTAECAVLEALVEGRWLTATEVSEIPPAAGLHPQVVRGSLKQLASHRLVERGGWGDSMRWGEFRITAAGLERVNEARQLRLA